MEFACFRFLFNAYANDTLLLVCCCFWADAYSILIYKHYLMRQILFLYVTLQFIYLTKINEIL